MLRIGLLGCGRIGQMHADLISNRVDAAELSMVYDIVGAAAQATAENTGAMVAGDPDELINSSAVDAVAICSSTDTHLDLLVRAAAAGKPVFVEKPLSFDLVALDRAADAVRDAGIAVQVGFNRRFDASHRLVGERVAAGGVGDVHLVRITSRDPAPPPIEYIRVSGGIFNDMTIHDFDMARFVTGSEVVDVTAFGAVRVDPAIGEAGDYDTAVITLTHTDGVITTIDNSRQAVYGYDQRVEVFGSAGMVASDNPLTTTTVVRDADGGHTSTVPYFFLDRYIPSYIAEWETFVSVARDGMPSPVTLADGRAPLVMAMAAGLSARQRRTVTIEEVGR